MNPLPITPSPETVAVLKQTALSERALAELKGVLRLIPNKDILLNTLPLQEAKASSEIENIVTTDDELYKGQVGQQIDPTSKEVHNYVSALHKGFDIITSSQILTSNNICEIQAILEGDNAGFRKQAGTVLKNNLGETVYEPPQELSAIQDLMNNLEQFINDDAMSDLNPLVKMAIIHHRFESIHPFYDGNGRTGRIINVLYLVQKGLLDIPILYLSRYIMTHKDSYYRLLQSTREDGNWEPWILFMLKGVEDTATQTTKLIEKIFRLMDQTKTRMESVLPKLVSQELIQSLFKHPYTKIEFFEEDLRVSRQTASKHLKALSENGFLEMVKQGRTHYFINQPLCHALIHVRDL